jgi:spermidine synthase
LVASRWSAFGRTDLVRDEEDLNEMVFFIDGTAGTSMYRFDKDIGSLDKHEFHHFPGYFPLKLLPEKEKEKVLIIGAGGGREVLLSLLGGAKEITAVEVNKDLVDMTTFRAWRWWLKKGEILYGQRRNNTTSLC